MKQKVNQKPSKIYYNTKHMGTSSAAAGQGHSSKIVPITNIQGELLFNSCYYSRACSQLFFCLKRHTNETNGSIQSKIYPFVSFALQTANNCNRSYYTYFHKIQNLLEVSTGTVDIGLKNQNLYFRERQAREMKSMFLKLVFN